MILAVAVGGTTAIVIAVWAQVWYSPQATRVLCLFDLQSLFQYQVRSRTESLNASEIANGILSSLVAITAGCAFVDYWGACLIGCTFLSPFPFLSLSPANTFSPSSLCSALLPWWVLAGVQAGHSGHSKSRTGAWRVVRVHSFNSHSQDPPSQGTGVWE